MKWLLLLLLLEKKAREDRVALCEAELELREHILVLSLPPDVGNAHFDHQRA